ncbi:HAD phosphatase subfamily IIIA [Synechococcus sp. PCC 7502]|uniref:YqeG family HAD IIIA-type phosphatase n=1 Tax=Synechococcus sp. PCC 7502 TaxID=1173263 RepID=UPI00029FF5DF|nr:YqeG family HAD IIIA-type phosphatase [Synechococcus sp. PCC 7502]AFY73847.1 HAD phosphatase subfamily IIIA [Synechococcus sp. PCC 7502]
MNLQQLIKPNLILAKPIWYLTADLIANYGLSGLILDVDDTLLGNDDREVSPAVRNWLDETRKICKIYLVSNNFSNSRIQAIATNLDLPYRSRAAKPSRRVVREALAAMELPCNQVGMVGDRILTDTIVGNRLGMFTILIQPPNQGKETSWLGGRSQIFRDWENWLMQKSGINKSGINI